MSRRRQRPAARGPGSRGPPPRIAPLPQVTASSLLFAAAHPAGALLPELLLGCVLGAALIAARGNLAAPVLGHAIYNGVVLAASLAKAGGGGAGG